MRPRSSALVAALVLATALAATPGWAAPLLGDASVVCVQTPADTAFDAANSQITPDDPNIGNAACGDLCAKWAKTCKSLVTTMKACWLGAVNKIASLRNVTCNELDDPAKQNCKDIVKAEKDAAKVFLLDNAELGQNFCEAGGLAACITNCS